MVLGIMNHKRLKQYKRVPKLTPDDAQRLWSNVEKRGRNQCWLWQASCGHKGSGQFIVNGGNFRPHRIVYAIKHGDPGPHPVVQTCGNLRCCNPNHLRLVEA